VREDGREKKPVEVGGSDKCVGTDTAGEGGRVEKTDAVR
jgi:hypothetical protein